MTPCSDLDDPTVWHDLIMGFVTHPMNYGADIAAVGTIALAAGIDPSRAIAKVQTFYHHNASRGVAVSPARLKGDWTSWRDRPYAANAGTEEKRKQGERWAALNEYIRRHGGAVTSVPGNKTLRVEVPKGSELPAKLTELGYNVSSHGTVTRVTGAQPVSPKVERLTRTVPSAFCEMDVLEIRLDGR